MKKYKLGKRIISVIVVLCLFLVGCSGNSGQTLQNADADKDVTIIWWSFPVFAQQNSDEAGTYEKRLIAAFEEQNPNIHVELGMLDFSSGPEKIENAITQGNVCDVVLDAPGRIVDYGKRGYLKNLDDMFTENFTSDVNNENLIKACKSGDTAYMYPLSSSPFYMVFNKEMLEDAGALDLVQVGWTTDDFVEILKKLKLKRYTPGSVYYDGTGGDQGTRAFIANLYSSSITDEDCLHYTINDANGVKGLELAKALVDNGFMVNGNFYNGSDDISNFVSGKSSFSILWGLSQQNSNQNALEVNDIKTVEVPYPSDDGIPTLEYLVNGFGVFDNGDVQKVAAAKKFIAFACDDSVWVPSDVIASGCLPVRTSFGSLYGESRMKNISTWSNYYCSYYNMVDGYSVMRGEWEHMLECIMFGDKTAKEAADDFVSHSETAMSAK